MMRALIFDCFGVLYWDDINRLYELVGDANRQAFDDLVHSFDHGFIETKDFYTQLTELTHVSEEEVRAVIRAKEVRNDDLIERVRGLKFSYKIGLLSNMGHDTLDTLFTKQELETLFDSVVISSAVGMIKPSRDIYEFALEQLGTEPEETVFIDDRPANTDGAERVGMKTILYTSNAQFEKELTSILSGDA